MGYKINSTWTKLREDDIKKLNEIIDDKYCCEREIGRKLNIMKKFNEAFQKEVSKFRFDIVLKFMKEHDWEWIHYENDKSFYAVPTKKDIIDVLKNEHLKHGLYEIIELGKTSYIVESGGIIFKMYIHDGKYYVDIMFDIAHFVKIK